jgi:LysR family transcriptional regulator, regulator for bpeEF and oprC
LYLVQDALAAGRLKEVLRDFNTEPRPVSVMYPPNRHQPQKLKVFVDWLTELYGHIPALQGTVNR